MKFFSKFIAGSILALAMQAGSAAILTITYKATDLIDIVPGADRWQFTYRANGSLNPFEGFNVSFNPSDFAALSVDSTPAGWLAYTLDPDLTFTTDGIFSSTIDGTGVLPAEFVVSFDWIGTGAPGSQPFELFDENFNVVGEGTTAPAALPEPESLVLMGGGLVAFAMVRRRYPRK